MNSPTTGFKRLCNISFFTDVKKTTEEFEEYIYRIYDTVASSKDGLSRTYYEDEMFARGAKEGIKSKAFITVFKDQNCTEVFYDWLERNAKGLIEKRLHTDLDEKKRVELITLCVGELSQILITVKSFELEEGLKKYQQIISNKLNTFIEYLNTSYLGKPLSLTSAEPSKPKLKWLGEITMLPTLFYDLLHGQEKGIGKNKITTSPLLLAEKKDVMEFLEKNFVNKEGKPLSKTTLSDYLNEGKPQKRQSLKKKIELPL